MCANHVAGSNMGGCVQIGLQCAMGVCQEDSPSNKQKWWCSFWSPTQEKKYGRAPGQPVANTKQRCDSELYQQIDVCSLETGFAPNPLGSTFETRSRVSPRRQFTYVPYLPHVECDWSPETGKTEEGKANETRLGR